MENEQKPKERIPLKEIQAKRQRARIVGKFCGYASLVFFIDFMYFFFQAAAIRTLTWGSRVHSSLAARYSYGISLRQGACGICLSPHLQGDAAKGDAAKAAEQVQRANDSI